jgi:hypothetical protein
MTDLLILAAVAAGLWALALLCAARRPCRRH